MRRNYCTVRDPGCFLRCLRGVRNGKFQSHQVAQVDSAAVPYSGPKTFARCRKFDNRSSFIAASFPMASTGLGGQAKTILINPSAEDQPIRRDGP